MLGIAEIYNEIVESDKKLGDNKANLLLETIAGKNRSNIAASILQSPDILKDAYKQSKFDSENSAQDELNKYLESLEGKIQKFKNALQELATTSISSGLLGGLIDTGTKLINILDSLIEKIGPLKTLLLSITGITLGKKGLMNIGVLDKKATWLDPITNLIKKFVTNEDGKSGSTATDAISDVTDGVEEATEKITGLKGAFGNIKSNTVGIFTKLGTGVKSIIPALSSASTGLVGVGAALTGLVVAIPAGVIAWKAYQNSYEQVSKRADELIDKFTSAKSEVESNNNTIQTLSGRYEELSKGVNYAGQNIGLTTEEFKEYQDVCNQIAEIYPSLVDSYDAQGNAILSLKGNVEGLTQAYIDAQKEAYNTLITADNVDDITNRFNQMSDTSLWDQFKDWGNDNAGGAIPLKEAIRKLDTFANATPDEYRMALMPGEHQLNRTQKEEDLANATYFENELGIDNNFTDAEFYEAQKKANLKRKEYNAEVEKARKQVIDLAEAYLKSEDSFYKEDKNVQSMLSMLLNNISDEDIVKYMGDEDGIVTKSLINGFSDSLLNMSKEAKSKLSEAYDLAGKVDEDTDIKSYVQQMEYIQAQLAKEGVEIPITFLFENEKDIINTLNNNIREISGGNTYVEDGLKTFIKNNGIDTTEEIEFWISVTKEATSAAEAIELYNEAINKAEIEREQEVKDAFLKSTATDDNKDIINDDAIRKAYREYKTLASELEEWDLNEELSKSVDEAYKSLEDLAKERNTTVEQILSTFAKAENNVQYKELNSWYDELSPEDQEVVYEIAINERTSSWVLKDWQHEFARTKTGAKEAEEAMRDLFTPMDEEDSFYTSTIQPYVDGIMSLKEALTKVRGGNLSTSDMLSLFEKFPALAGKSRNLEDAIEDLIDDMKAGIGDDFEEKLKEIGEEAGLTKEQLEALRDMLINMDGALDLEHEKEVMQNFYTAVNESASSTGLSSASIGNIKDMVAATEGYNVEGLFEKTANGIHLNAVKLRELQAEYIKQKKLGIKDHLKDLTSEYATLSEEIKNTTDPNEKLIKQNKLADLGKQIEETAILSSQYDGLTSAFYRWEQAQQTANDGAKFDSLIDYKDTAKDLYKEGRTNTDDFISFVDVVSNKDLSKANGEEAAKEYESWANTIKGTSYSVNSFLKGNGEGLNNILNAMRQLNYATKDSDGNWQVKLNGKDMESAAKDLGISVEFLTSMLEKANEYGKWNIEFDGIDSIYSEENYQTFQERIDASKKKLEDLGAEPVEINIDIEAKKENVDAIDAEIAKAQAKIKEINESTDMSEAIKTEQLEIASTSLDILIAKKNEATRPAYMSLDTSQVNASMVEPLTLLQNYRKAVEELATLEADPNVDTEKLEAAKAKVDECLTSIQGLEEETKVSLGFEQDASLETIRAQLEADQIEIPLTGKLSEDDTSIQEFEERVTNVTGEKELTIKVTTELDDNFDKLQDATNLAGGESTSGASIDVKAVVTEVDLEMLTKLKGDPVLNIPAEIKYTVWEENITNYKAGKTYNIDDAEITYSPNFNNISDSKGNSVLNIPAEVKYTVDPSNIAQYRNSRTYDINDAEITYTVNMDAVSEAKGSSVLNIPAEVIYTVNSGNITTYKDSKASDINDAIIVYNVNSGKIEAYKASGDANGKGTITYDVNKKAVDSFKSTVDGKGTITYSAVRSVDFNSTMYTLKNQTGTITYNIKTNGSVPSGGVSPVNGTAHVSGSAFANGSINHKEGDWTVGGTGGTALVGELGPEILVRNGHFFTIGDESAEFINVRPNDIIFNHEQTKEILEHGYITKGNKRGKAFAQGTVNASGRAFAYTANGGGGSIPVTSSTTKKKTTTSSNNNSNNNSNDDAEKTKETFDWIEILINRIEEAISRLEITANSAYNTLSTRNKALAKEIDQVVKEIDAQEAGYERYIKQANSVGLSSEWAKKVREGTIDISTIEDEELIEKIGEYQTWFDKAQQCKTAVKELQEQEKDLYKQRFDNIASLYDAAVQRRDNQKSLIESYSTLAETQGYAASGNYAKALKKVEEKRQGNLTTERDKLQAELDTAVQEGKIAKYSEAWYEMVAAIQEVDIALVDSQNTMAEYDREIQQIKWDRFDLLQEKIANVVNDMDYLINIVSDAEMFDEDTAEITNQGLATLGLHDANYEIYLDQVAQYKKEINKLNEEIAKNPYDTKLTERKQELIEKQQEAALAAKQEKDAMIELVEQGINAQLNSMKKLIDTYTKALDSEKDLYEYRKKTKDQTAEIAKLEKQVAAYRNDTSEEGKAKLRKAQTSLDEAKQSLKESEYDKYISNQKELLDSMYETYDEIMTDKLKNTDELIKGVKDEVNANTTTIKQTLETEAGKLGTTISTAVTTAFSSKTVEKGTDKAVSEVKTEQKNTNTKADTQATTNKNTASATQTKTTQAEKKTTTTSSTPASSTTTTTTKKEETKKEDTKKVDTSFFVKLDAKDRVSDSYKKKLDKDVSIIDRLKYFDFKYDKTNRAKYYEGMKLGKKSAYTGTAAQNSSMIKWMKANGYKKGVYNLKEDEYAYTQEVAPEAIVRKDGSVLMPLTAGTSVLNGNATKNFYDFMNNPLEYMTDIMSKNLVSSSPDNTSIGNTIETKVDLTLNLPNVTNYEEFKNKMVKDKNFEKTIQAMTIDLVAGKSSLSKYKR